jgi:hypothetical protein
VAVTQNCITTSHYRSAAQGLAVAVLLIAAAGIAHAQSNAPAAAGLAPSGGANSPGAPPSPAGAPPKSTLPPPPPQATNQGPNQVPNQTSSQAPNQVPAQAPNQAPNQAGAPGQNQASALPSPPDEKRGFLNGLGDWWNDSIANFNTKMKEQQAKVDEFNKQQSAAAKDATEAMKNAAGAMFSSSKVLEIQQLCPVAGNGAPDCASAATNVCKAKGFSDGHPIDIRTAERCKASLWVSGQTPTAADCSVETVLLRVACQQ